MNKKIHVYSCVIYELKIKLFLQDNVNADSITVHKIGDESTELQFVNNDDGSIEITESISDENIELEIKNISDVSKMSKYVNSDAKKVGGYGKRCYKYYKLFKKYN